MIAIDQTPDTKLERRAHEGDPSEAHVLLADVRQKFPRPGRNFLTNVSEQHVCLGKSPSSWARRSRGFCRSLD